jgi:hypothetical protein
MTIVMEEGMFMIHLTGVIEVVVPISKCHHEQIPLVENTFLFLSAVTCYTSPTKLIFVRPSSTYESWQQNKHTNEKTGFPLLVQ